MMTSRLGGDNLDVQSAGSLVAEFPNVVVARTFSKSYALAGMRLGYLLGAPDIIEHIERMMIPGGSASSVALAAGKAALEDADYHRVSVSRLVARA